MAAFFFLLAIIGGALVGDLVWENTTAGEITVLDRTVTGYPQGWLLAATAALGFVVGLLLVASLHSTKARRARRRQYRSMERGRQDHDLELAREDVSWLDEHAGRPQTAADTGKRFQQQSEPLYEQTRRAAGLRDDRRYQ
jgi:hypothetical protein